MSLRKRGDTRYAKTLPIRFPLPAGPVPTETPVASCQWTALRRDISTCSKHKASPPFMICARSSVGSIWNLFEVGVGLEDGARKRLAPVLGVDPAAEVASVEEPPPVLLDASALAAGAAASAAAGATVAVCLAEGLSSTFQAFVNFIARNFAASSAYCEKRIDASPT